MDWWEILLGIGATLLVGIPTAKAIMKKKVAHLRELARSMDEALKPDSPGGENISKEEALDIWADLKTLIGV